VPAIIDTAANFKIESIITRVIAWLKILANRFEQLVVNPVVDGKLRIEFQGAVKSNCTGCREANIRRAQDQFVNCDQSRAYLVFCFRLLEMQFS
jgi:hypothetical protein